MLTLCLGQKCDKVDQKSSLSNIQFIIDAIFDIHIIYGDHWRRRRRIMTLPSPTRWSEVHVLLGRMRQTM